MTAIRVRGIGPHVDTRLTLNPGGVSTLRGGSGSGKSTILHAIACALWGTDATGAPFDRALLSAPRGTAWRFTRSLGELRAAVLVAGKLVQPEDDRQLGLFGGAR